MFCIAITSLGEQCTLDSLSAASITVRIASANLLQEESVKRQGASSHLISRLDCIFNGGLGALMCLNAGGSNVLSE